VTPSNGVPAPDAAAAPAPSQNTPPPQKKQGQKSYQLKWPAAEISRIASRVRSDYRNAISDHDRRIRRWVEFYRRWRCAVDAPLMGEEDASNLPVPYCRWNVFTKWAKEMDGLFGDDAEIVAVPVGPSDYRKDKKISRYMTWRVFNSMKLLSPFCVFVLRKLIFGKSIAYSPWKRDTFEVAGQTVVNYEGPEFTPLWPDDFIAPAEDVETLHDFSFVIRRVRVTPDQLLVGEQEGRYQGITENWETIVNLAQHGTQREFQGEEVKREKDDAEGVVYERPVSSGEWLMVLEWYGKWRPLKGAQDANEWDFKLRQMRQKEFVIRYLLDLNLVIGVQSLEELYPTMKNRRPFVESSMCKDGTYWSPGMCEMLIDLEDELKVNHNLGTEGAQLATSPPVGYRPASGVTPETIILKPGLGIPLDNPQTDIVQLKYNVNLEALTWKEQSILSFGEKLTGLSDLQLGRQSDRPNAPRTATQTVKLLEEGNVRISLDTKVLREDMALVLGHFWELEFMFSPEQTFFRVTEEDAGGLFETQNGAAAITMEDRDGRYDFRLEFAGSVWSKEVKKEQALARYQLDLQNPLIVQNPRALWAVTRDAHEALGDPNFADLVPEPPAPDIPIDPREEWTRMQEGEDVHVNPMDNDQVHMIRHFRDWQESQADPNRDPEAERALHSHYLNHMAQLQQKKLQQAVIEQTMQAAAQSSGGDPLQFLHGLFGNPPTQPAGNPQATGPNIYSGHQANESLHGAS
jgi:hypothetical protein